MGLPQLIQWTKTLNSNQKSALRVVSLDALLCLESFLLFLAQTPAILSAFVTFLQGAKALIDLQISLIELLILQLDIENQIINAILQPYKAFRAQLDGQLAQLPLAAFDSCPPIKTIEDFVRDGFNDFTSNTPPLNKIKSINEWIKRKEFEYAHRQSYIQKLAAKVEELKAIETMFDALIQAINAQFS